jgi:sec-independent protein translocase protein TatA
MTLQSIFLILGLGGQEMIFIALIILLLFGAKKIPDLMKGLGKGIREFKDASKEVKENIEKGMEETN